MKIHEYQAKELLARNGVPVQRGVVIFSAGEINKALAELDSYPVMLKAQVHAGGRGKAGGIRMAQNAAEAESLAVEMFGMRLVTPQTGADGKVVRRILVTEAVDIARELYVGLTLDRTRSRLVFMASTEGGVEIETVAARSPEKIIREVMDAGTGLLPFQCRRIALALGLTGPLFRAGADFARQLAEAFMAYDCSLAEVNPLVVTAGGDLMALDVKINIDDSALGRHPDIAAMRDPDEEEPLEVEASRYRLNYIKLDGSVGCMVNGAGLAMATMDIIKLAGTEPANFLDVGGGASAETVENGFRILLKDPDVRAVLINIFGGIVRCDRVASGVIDAVKKVNVRVPVVVRLAGTNADLAAELLAGSGIDFLVAADLADAAAKVTTALTS